VANLPLHWGKAPKWLFRRMVALSQGIFQVLSYEYGTQEILQRISDPFWFQALSCVLGYDWHSSGTTTVTCGALKEAIDPEIFGFAVAGGKGKASRKTLQEITCIGQNYNLSTQSIEQLQYASRMTAKIDNNALQDGHQLYHHVMFFTEGGAWAVIQQGLNDDTSYARRYHWHCDHVSSFINEPHEAILGQQITRVLDMTSKQSSETQKISLDLVNDHPRHLMRDWHQLLKPAQQHTLDEFTNQQKTTPISCLDMPRLISWKKMKEIYDVHPTNYEELLAMKGVGANTVRALALISDLIYGEQPSWKDPVRYTFAHGGKDGVPYPVDRKAMDESAILLKQGIEQAKLGDNEKIRALRRLKNFLPVNN